MFAERTKTVTPAGPGGTAILSAPAAAVTEPYHYLSPPPLSDIDAGTPASMQCAIMCILIADDHAAVRRGLRDILDDALPGAQIAEACDGDEVLHNLAVSEFDLLLLDINMPGRDGLELLRDVKSAYPQLPVIMVSVQPKDQYAMRCVQAGAAAYISKDSVAEELAPTARKILAGGSSLCAV